MLCRLQAHAKSATWQNLVHKTAVMDLRRPALCAHALRDKAREPASLIRHRDRLFSITTILYSVVCEKLRNVLSIINRT